MTLKEYIEQSDLKGKRGKDHAEFFGMSPAYFSQIMSKKRKPSVDFAMVIEKKTDGAVPWTVWFEESGAAAEGESA